VRGMTDNMTIGERVAFYRNRRGMSQEVLDKWESYQQSRYSRLSRRLPPLVTDALTASQQYGADTDDGLHAHRLLASVYQLATGFLTKVGEADLASLSATKGLSAAHASGSELMIGSLYRSVAHALLAIGEYEQAVALTRAVSDGLQSSLGAATPEYLSVYGTLQLVGVVAAARQDNRTDATTFLDEAEESAHRLGHDANYLWTAFGPTNVAIHRISAAMELGDVQVAIDLGPRIDTTGLPTERRVRHAIETARAFARWNRVESALDTLLDAESQAPEQVRYHRLSRILVQEMLRRPRPAPRVIGLAARMGVHRTDPSDRP
jgi:hypothetical protein